MKNEVASVKEHQKTPSQHVIPVRRQMLPASPSKPSPQKIIHDSNNNQMETKNLQTTSNLNGGQQTMETLSTYEKQFQGQLDIEMTHAKI